MAPPLMGEHWPARSQARDSPAGTGIRAGVPVGDHAMANEDPARSKPQITAAVLTEQARNRDPTNWS